MKPLAKTAVTAGVIAAVAVLVVVTKPGSKAGTGGPGPRSSAARPHPGTGPSPHGTGPHASASPSAGPSGSVAISSGTVTTTGSAGPVASGIAEPWRDHGQNATVRSDDPPLLGSPVTQPLMTPRWNEAMTIRFFGLKKHYRAFTSAKSFSPATIEQLHGAAVRVSGAFMPIDPVPDDGEVSRFWLANPVVVMAGCVFCSPPTMGDLIYVTSDKPFEVDREKLFSSVVILELLGQLRLGPESTKDGVQYLFAMELRKRLE